MVLSCCSVFLNLCLVLAVHNTSTALPTLVTDATPIRSTSNPAPVRSSYLKSQIMKSCPFTVLGVSLVTLKFWYTLLPFWEMDLMRAFWKSSFGCSAIFFSCGLVMVGCYCVCNGGINFHGFGFLEQWSDINLTLLNT